MHARYGVMSKVVPASRLESGCECKISHILLCKLMQPSRWCKQDTEAKCIKLHFEQTFGGNSTLYILRWKLFRISGKSTATEHCDIDCITSKAYANKMLDFYGIHNCADASGRDTQSDSRRRSAKFCCFHSAFIISLISVRENRSNCWKWYRIEYGYNLCI